jgi:outer membrane protein OmpA-like peptidoglycan-associated protein
MPKRSEKCWRALAIGAFVWAALAAFVLLRGPNAPGSLAALNWQTENRATQALAAAGMDWAKVRVRDGVMTVSGAPRSQRGIASVSAIAQASTRAQFGFPGVYYKVAEDFRASPVSVSVLRSPAKVAAPSVAPPSATAPIVAAPSTPTQCNQLFERAIADREIRFATGSAQLPASAYPLLAALTDVARQCGAYKITIGGHTDTRGDPAYNQALSEQRAKSVLNYLAAHGATRAQLAAIGYGASRPLSTEHTYAAHRQNRRITFAVSNIP